MTHKLIIALVAVIAWLGQSCETDPAFDFKDDGKIYFKYPKKVNDLGIETDLLVDSSYCIWERTSGWERYFVDSITDYGSP